MQLTLSVIVPTYNRRDSLKKTIESVLKQTYQDFELLICDDGSTDGTEGMVKSFSDIRIRWIPGTNSGKPAVPRNRGLMKAKGEWLAFIDSDDLWMPEKLEKQIKAASMHSVKAVCTNAKILKNNTILEEPYFKNLKNRMLQFDDLLDVNPVICSSMLIKKSIVQQMRGFPEDKKFKAVEDYVLWLSSSMLTDIYYLCEPLTIYRDEPQFSIRGEAVTNEKVNYARIMIECIKRIKHLKRSQFFFFKKIILSLLKRTYLYCKYTIKTYLKKLIK